MQEFEREQKRMAKVGAAAAAAVSWLCFSFDPTAHKKKMQVSWWGSIDTIDTKAARKREREKLVLLFEGSIKVMGPANLSSRVIFSDGYGRWTLLSLVSTNFSFVKLLLLHGSIRCFETSSRAELFLDGVAARSAPVESSQFKSQSHHAILVH